MVAILKLSDIKVSLDKLKTIRSILEQAEQEGLDGVILIDKGVKISLEPE